MADVVHEKVLAYKKYLDRSPAEDKIPRVFRKLEKADITLDILQNTGIGKTVNSFRKHEGSIGDQARTLVRSWKQLLSGASPQQSSLQCETVSETSYNSHYVTPRLDGSVTPGPEDGESQDNGGESQDNGGKSQDNGQTEGEDKAQRGPRMDEPGYTFFNQQKEKNTSSSNKRGPRMDEPQKEKNTSSSNKRGPRMDEPGSTFFNPQKEKNTSSSNKHKNEGHKKTKDNNINNVCDKTTEESAPLVSKANLKETEKYAELSPDEGEGGSYSTSKRKHGGTNDMKQPDRKRQKVNVDDAAVPGSSSEGMEGAPPAEDLNVVDEKQQGMSFEDFLSYDTGTVSKKKKVPTATLR